MAWAPFNKAIIVPRLPELPHINIRQSQCFVKRGSVPFEFDMTVVTVFIFFKDRQMYIFSLLIF